MSQETPRCTVLFLRSSSLFFHLLQFWCSHARGIPFLRILCIFTEQVLAQFEVLRNL